jgi:Flp pilus assembly protein TadD
MTVDRPPHRPDDEEVRGAKKLGLPASDEHADTMLAAARKAFEAKSYANAIAILEGIVIARPDDPRIYEAFGVVHLALGEPDAARLCFEAAVEIDPTTVVANVNLGEVAWRKKKDAGAARLHLDRVVARDGDGPFGKRARLTLRQIERASR